MLPTTDYGAPGAGIPQGNDLMVTRFFKRQPKIDRDLPSNTAPIRRSPAAENTRIPHSPAPSGLAWDSVVVDVETTGLFSGGTDRVIEIAAIRLSPEGEVLDRIETLIDPARDVGPTHIHGISPSDLVGAPSFDSIIDDVTSLVAGAAVVAHNAAFDVRFLASEFVRAGSTFPDTATICTMQLPARLGMKLPAVNLKACCESFGIEYLTSRAHSAMYDVSVTAELYSHLLAIAPSQPPTLGELGAKTRVADRVEWPAMAPSGLRHPRRTAQERQDESFGYLHRLASTVGNRRGIDPDQAPYFALLDRVLEDGIVDETETAALIRLAHDLGLGTSDATKANHDYLRFLIQAAWEDGIITNSERDELDRAAHLLGIPNDELDELVHSLKPRHTTHHTSPAPHELTGMSVCFTGTMSTRRADLELLAQGAGLSVRKSVTKTLDILVVADALSQSGKAVKARNYGTRVVTEGAFLRKLGVNT